MASTTRVLALRDALLSLTTTACPGVQVTGYWPGPDTASEGIYWAGAQQDTGTQARAGVSNLKAARQHRDERIVCGLILHTWRTANQVTELGAAEDLVWGWYGAIESAVATAPSLAGVVQWIESLEAVGSAVKFDKGWAVEVAVTVTAIARLT